MVETSESINVLLAGRAATYRLFQNLFGNEPDDGVFERFEEEAVQEILSLFAMENSTHFARALVAFLGMVAQSKADLNENIEKISNGFTRLFVGPGAVEAEPWESVYETKEHILFQSVTLEVRKAYVAQGFIPNNYPHVADDHIALELDFMAALGAQLADSFDEGDTEAAAGYLKASEDFLHEHLLKWVPAFAVALEGARHNYFYKEAGALLNEFLKVDAEGLIEIRSLLES